MLHSIDLQNSFDADTPAERPRLPGAEKAHSSLYYITAPGYKSRPLPRPAAKYAGFPGVFYFFEVSGELFAKTGGINFCEKFLHFHAAEYGIRAGGVLYYIGYHSILGE
ncbi:MAG: hypothetical protein ACI3XT_06560 [Butyricicoccaceae bacterium]